MTSVLVFMGAHAPVVAECIMGIGGQANNPILALGGGGMATVYLAKDLKHDRDVAVKVLRPELAAALGPERFLREIKIAARLQHPHMLPLHDSGEVDGFLYYVMPYVKGESLRERLLPGRIKLLSVYCQAVWWQSSWQWNAHAAVQRGSVSQSSCVIRGR